MTETYKLGMKAVLYYDDGTTGADLLAGMAVASNVRDLTIDGTTGEADITTRGNAGWSATAPTTRAGTMEFEVLFLPDDDFYDTLYNAWITSTPVRMCALTDERTSASGGNDSVGIIADYSITNFTRSEPLEGGIMFSVTAKIAQFLEAITNGMSTLT